MVNHDWFADGHCIAAPDARAAKLECVRLYGHLPDHVRAWSVDDTLTYMRSDSPVVTALANCLVERGDELGQRAAAWLLMNEDEAWGQFIGPMLDDIEGRMAHE